MALPCARGVRRRKGSGGHCTLLSRASRERPEPGEEPYARKVERLVMNDLLFLDNRAREDSELAARSISRLTRWLTSGRALRRAHLLQRESVLLQRQLRHARSSLRANEARLERSLLRLQQLEQATTTAAGSGGSSAELSPSSFSHHHFGTSALHSSPLSLSEREHWVPVAFSRDLDKRTLIPFHLEMVPWVVFRGSDGEPGCLHDECAHRACPLSIGQVKNGRIQCSYHGWEFASSGECEVMPSCAFRPNIFVSSMPCVEVDGIIYVWPGEELPSTSVPSFAPPEGYQTVAELAMDVNVPHGGLMESLVQCGSKSFRSVSEKRLCNGASGSSELGDMLKLPSHVVRIMRGSLQPEVRDISFVPPTTVSSILSVAQKASPGIGASSDCHVYQVHVCLPQSENWTRVLYRLAVDFTPPGRSRRPSGGEPLWLEFARQVLRELEEEVSNVNAQLQNEQAKQTTS